MEKETFRGNCYYILCCLLVIMCFYARESEKGGDRQKQVMTSLISAYYMCYITVCGDGCAR